MREREIEFRISSAEGGAAFPVRVVPRAGKNEKLQAKIREES